MALSGKLPFHAAPLVAAGLFALTMVLAPLKGRAQAIPPDRLPLPGTWERAGVEGGIPVRANVCAVVTDMPYGADPTGSLGASDAIQRAIDRCPAHQVVVVPPGRYRIDRRLKIDRSITLRGAGAATVFEVFTDGGAVLLQGALPWPPPKNNPQFFMPLLDAPRASTALELVNPMLVRPGMVVMVDELDDPDLVWMKSGGAHRARASMHMVEAKSGSRISFRPPLPIDYRREPRLSVFPSILSFAGVEDIKFQTSLPRLGQFIEIFAAWNVWVRGSEFTGMPAKAIVAAWAGHLEFRRNILRDQSNGGPNSEGIDLLADVNWSLVVDNICSAGGFPAITIGDGGASANYSGGFGNVVAYNYCVDSYYTDPPTSLSHGIMAADIGMHSPHPQFNLFEGNIVGKFGFDAYHGSASHNVLFRNLATGSNRWQHATNRTAIQIDRRNLHYSIIGNVIGQQGRPFSFEFATKSGWTGSTAFRLGYPDVGNGGYAGTFPPTPLAAANGGPRDLFVEPVGTAHGTTLIDGNWISNQDRQVWSGPPRQLPDSLFLAGKPAWFGGLAWPPIDPGRPVTNDPTIIPAGFRFVHGKDPPP